MERPPLPDEKLTENAQHLIEEAVILAGNQPPDARHLLRAILRHQRPLAEQLLPHLDLNALDQALERELENPHSHIAIPYEGIIDLAIRIAEREG